MAEQQSRVDAGTFLERIHGKIPQRPDIPGGTLEHMKQDSVPVLAHQAVQVAINVMRSRMQDPSLVYAGDMQVLYETVSAEFQGWRRQCVHGDRMHDFDKRKDDFLAAAHQIFAAQQEEERSREQQKRAA